VKVKGRVASLLEVGTGFHPTPLCPPASRGKAGRENIYLNGAIPSTMLRAGLGMKKAEIGRKFDEIVAFAVAAHLEPEILLVDEVLAVGDAAFQKKCLGKMGGCQPGGAVGSDSGV
jgi:lipopolysaccharide transport system ATP-binding protein